MARCVNKVILLGNLGRDAELSYTPSGQAVAKVSLATNRRWKDKNGEWQEETEWHNLVLWARLAESYSQYLTKGQKIYVEGRLKSRSWEREGVKHNATDVVVDTVVFAGAGRGEEGGPRQAAGAPARPAAAPAGPAPAGPPPAGPPPNLDEGPQPDITDDDIPF